MTRAFELDFETKVGYVQAEKRRDAVCGRKIRSRGDTNDSE